MHSDRPNLSLPCERYNSHGCRIDLVDYLVLLTAKQVCPRLGVIGSVCCTRRARRQPPAAASPRHPWPPMRTSRLIHYALGAIVQIAAARRAPTAAGKPHSAACAANVRAAAAGASAGGSSAPDVDSSGLRASLGCASAQRVRVSGAARACAPLRVRTRAMPNAVAEEVGRPPETRKLRSNYVTDM
jgi:hypothetical protein